jgi:hypothetical protein
MGHSNSHENKLLRLGLSREDNVSNSKLSLARDSLSALLYAKMRFCSPENERTVISNRFSPKRIHQKDLLPLSIEGLSVHGILLALSR